MTDQSPSAKDAPIRRDWIAKSAAGALLGFTLALACSGLFAAAASGMTPGARAQLTMWLLTPIWLTVAASSYFFHSGLRAWLWLIAANVAAFGLLALIRLT